jgi:hypothetical protein
MGEASNQHFFRVVGHGRIGNDHGLCSAVGKPRHGVLQRHRPCQPCALRARGVDGHPDPADGRAGGNVVHHHDGFQARARVVYLYDLLRPEPVDVFESSDHEASSVSRAARTIRDTLGM